jgi:hypothetical protein
MTVGEDAAFGADLAAIRGVLAHLFPIHIKLRLASWAYSIE